MEISELNFVQNFQEKVEVETETAWSKAAQHNLQTVWPPPENEVRAQRSAGKL